jgi:hypothetical protein
MHDLFRAELLRFRGWAIAYGLLHLLVLGFLARQVDLAQQPLIVYRVIAAAYAVSGLLFGLFQMGGYRRPNTWLQLLHRPLPHARVASALLAASALLILVAIALPVLAIALWQHAMTERVVDLRHWMLPLASWLIAGAAYLAGAYAMLGGRRHGIAGMVFLALLFAIDAGGLAAIAMQTLFAAWLAAMVLIAFKPDLGMPPRHPLAVVATALPLQLGAYFALIMLCFGVELLWIVEGSHPNNSTPPRGGFVEANKAEGRDLMQAGLAVSTHADAALWHEQVALSEVFSSGREFAALPRRGELTNRMPMEFDDAPNRLRWVFSHDRMRFVGSGLADGRAAGVLGIGDGGVAFDVPPLPIGSAPGLGEGDGLLLAGGAIHQYSSEGRRITPRIRLPRDEVFANTPAGVGDSVMLLSDRALYFFDGRGFAESDAPLTPRLRVPLPGAIGNLTRIEGIELVDGYLLSFAYTSTAHNALVDPYQVLLHAHDDGRVDAVARRALRLDYPDWHRYELWWLSPAMRTLYVAIKGWMAPASPLAVVDAPAPPRTIVVLAVLLSLLSMLAAIGLGARRALSRVERMAWALACALIGLPALISLYLLYPARESLAAARTPAAAAA